MNKSLRNVKRFFLILSFLFLVRSQIIDEIHDESFFVDNYTAKELIIQNTAQEFNLIKDVSLPYNAKKEEIIAIMKMLNQVAGECDQLSMLKSWRKYSDLGIIAKVKCFLKEKNLDENCIKIETSMVEFLNIHFMENHSIEEMIRKIKITLDSLDTQKISIANDNISKTEKRSQEITKNFTIEQSEKEPEVNILKSILLTKQDEKQNNTEFLLNLTFVNESNKNKQNISSETFIVKKNEFKANISEKTFFETNENNTNEKKERTNEEEKQSSTALNNPISELINSSSDPIKKEEIYQIVYQVRENSENNDSAKKNAIKNTSILNEIEEKSSLVESNITNSSLEGLEKSQLLTKTGLQILLNTIQIAIIFCSLS